MSKLHTHTNPNPNPKQTTYHYFPSSPLFQKHLHYLKTIVRQKIKQSIIISVEVSSQDKSKHRLQKMLTKYGSHHLGLLETSVLKFICLRKCFQYLSSFYLVTLPVAQKILDILPDDLVKLGEDGDDILPDDIYKLYGNLTSVYWKDKRLITKTDTLYLGTPTSGPSLQIDTLPIDVVYTWVNHRCPNWKKGLDGYLESDHFQLHQPIYNNEFMDLNRYRNRNELQYSLRSLEQYMPWVRHIYLVTAGQVPDWLNQDHPKITVVDHRDIIEPQYLPTFNSICLESHLHRIPNLSEYFIYFNDDLFINRPVKKSDFLNGDGQLLLYAQESPYRARCDYFKTSVESLLPETDPELLQENGELQRELNIFIESCYKLFKITPKGKASCHESGHYSQWKNVNRLLDDMFTVEDRKFISHYPQIQLKTTCRKLEKMFQEEFQRTRNSRFRSIQCVGTTNSLYPYYNYYTDQAKIIDHHQMTQTIYFQNNQFINDIQFRALQQFNPTFFVIQDSTPNKDKDNDQQFQETLERLYPEPSSFEKGRKRVLKGS